MLGGVPGLRVADPASVRAAARAAGDPRDIGRRLGVGSLLEGSVRLSGDRLRVTTHLVSAEQGFDLWSETFEQPGADLQAVRDSIARGVMATLRRQARVRPAPVTAPGAYLAVLHGRDALARGTGDYLDEALAAFGEAVRLDSGYSPAWAGLAAAHAEELRAGVRAPSEAAEHARTAADRALALDSLEVRALLARGTVRMLYDRAWADAAADLRRAAALDPNRPGATHRLAHLFLAEGRLDSALDASRAAIARSPLDAALRVHLGWHYVMAGQDTLAQAALVGAGALDGVPVTDEHAALLLEATGDTAGGIPRLARAVSASPGRVDLLAELARLYAGAGAPDSARALLARMRALADARYVSPYALALVHAALGETRPALDALDRALRERDPAVLDLPLDPRLTSLRRDPRAAGLVRRLAPDYNPPTSTPRPPAPGL
jgi:tetratricopeptide (TPR) repeat protein